MPHAYPHILVLSHRRSGTHLTIDAIRNNFPPYSGAHINLDRLPARHPNPLPLATVQEKLAEKPRVIKSHMHANVDAFFEHDDAHVSLAKRLLDEAVVIYVVRDGRDVLTSLFYYMQEHHSERMMDVTTGEFLHMKNELDDNSYGAALNRIDYWAEHVREWCKCEQTFPVTFEALTTDYTAAVRRIGKRLDLPPPDAPVNVVRRRKSPLDQPLMRRVAGWFDALHRRGLAAVGLKEYTAKNFRKGAIGDHQTLFSKEDLAYFNRQAGSVLEQYCK